MTRTLAPSFPDVCGIEHDIRSAASEGIAVERGQRFGLQTGATISDLVLPVTMPITEWIEIAVFDATDLPIPGATTITNPTSNVDISGQWGGEADAAGSSTTTEWASGIGDSNDVNASRALNARFPDPPGEVVSAQLRVAARLTPGFSLGSIVPLIWNADSAFNYLPLVDAAVALSSSFTVLSWPVAWLPSSGQFDRPLTGDEWGRVDTGHLLGVGVVGDGGGIDVAWLELETATRPEKRLATGYLAPGSADTWQTIPLLNPADHTATTISTTTYPELVVVARAVNRINPSAAVTATWRDLRGGTFAGMPAYQNTAGGTFTADNLKLRGCLFRDSMGNVLEGSQPFDQVGLATQNVSRTVELGTETYNTIRAGIVPVTGAAGINVYANAAHGVTDNTPSQGLDEAELNANIVGPGSGQVELAAGFRPDAPGRLLAHSGGFLTGTGTYAELEAAYATYADLEAGVATYGDLTGDDVAPVVSLVKGFTAAATLAVEEVTVGTGASCVPTVTAAKVTWDTAGGYTPGSVFEIQRLVAGETIDLGTAVATLGFFTDLGAPRGVELRYRARVIEPDGGASIWRTTDAITLTLEPATLMISSPTTGIVLAYYIDEGDRVWTPGDDLSFFQPQGGGPPLGYRSAEPPGDSFTRTLILGADDLPVTGKAAGDALIAMVLAGPVEVIDEAQGYWFANATVTGVIQIEPGAVHKATVTFTEADRDD